MTANEESILIESAAKGNKECQEKIIKENIGLVKSIAKRFFGRGYDAEDIIQLGMIGLFKAIRKFDLSYGVRFSTYAVPMIGGEIKKFLRDDGYIKVSRSVKELNIKISRLCGEYEAKEGKSPKISYIAKMLNESEENIVYAMSASEAVISLDGESCEDKASAAEKIEDKKAFSEDGIIDRIIINDMLEKLKPRERKIIVMRYYMGMTQKEVAEKVAVSQVQVSRIEKKLLETIKEKMNNN